MGSFEDSIKKIFEDKSIKAPSNIWDGVKSSLNDELVQTYRSRQTFYKWIAVAAILLAFTSLAFQYYPLLYVANSEVAEVHGGETFNALLAEHQAYFYSSESNRTSSKQPNFHYTNKVLFHPIMVDRENKQDRLYSKFVGKDEELENSSGQTLVNLKSLPVGILEVEVDGAIYPYHQGAYYRQSIQKDRGNDAKLWAGLEAGAGNFNSPGSSAFSGSINESSLASALGSDGFVNPTSDVNPDMDPGLATSIGLDFGLRLGGKWTLETGVAYTNVDSRGDASINVLDVYTITSSDFSGPLSGNSDVAVQGTAASRETSFEIQDSYDYDLDVKSNLRFTSIPMKAGYYLLDNRMSVRLNVGLAANYLVGSQVSGSGDVLNGSADDSFNTWSFDGLGGVELGYSIFDRFDLTFEPNYRQSITPINESTSTSSRFILQTGLRYKIQ